MSKARSYANVYGKWMRGIQQAVPNDSERCKLYEYIIWLQLSRVYGDGSVPPKDELSQAASVALIMIEGDLEEVCEGKSTRIDKIRNNLKQFQDISTDIGVEETDMGNNETHMEPISGIKEPISVPQGKTRLDKTKLGKAAQGNAGADAPANGEPLDIFELGLNLLRKGYKVDPKKLQDRYWSICNAKAPYAYAASVFAMLQDQQTGPIHAFFIESTQTHNIEAFGIYGVAVKKGLLEVRLRKSAAEAIGEVGKQQALKKYAELYGVTDVEFVINGDGT